MTNPHVVSRRRPTRARPRLSRGPKPLKPSTSSSPPPSSPQDESSPLKPSSAPKTFDPNTAKTVSVKEAAYRLNKHPDTIRAWLRAGRLRGWQPGGHACSILVSMASLEEVLAASEANCRRVTGSRPA